MSFLLFIHFALVLGTPLKGERAKASVTENHYDAKYFEWQKSMGITGAKFNRIFFEKEVEGKEVVADFGGGGGYMLDGFNNKRKILIELNDVARNAASSGLEKYKTLDEVPKDVVDTMISSHCLEHVESPLNTLRKAYKIIKRGGMIVVLVPHDEIRSVYKEKDINHHIYTWNAMTLGHLVHDAGFEIITAEEVQHQWVSESIWNEKGANEWHRRAKEEAKNNNNYQIRVVGRKPL